MKKWVTISFIGFYLTWVLNLLFSLPYLFYFNTAFIAWLVAESRKDKTLLLLIPLLIMRLSQLFNMQGKYLILIAAVVVFGIIMIYLNKKKIDATNFRLSVLAVFIEVVSYS